MRCKRSYHETGHNLLSPEVELNYKTQETVYISRCESLKIKAKVVQRFMAMSFSLY